MRLPRMTTGRWMVVVAVFAISIAVGKLLRDFGSKEIPRAAVVGFVCVIASLPMLVPLIEFIRTFRSPD